jgi:ABC-type ATPase with predicted acetyltransferase domain
MLTTGTDTRARPGMACRECNDLLVAPKSSAYVSNHEIRHVWSCESCGHEIEMVQPCPLLKKICRACMRGVRMFSYIDVPVARRPLMEKAADKPGLFAAR